MFGPGQGFALRNPASGVGGLGGFAAFRRYRGGRKAERSEKNQGTTEKSILTSGLNDKSMPDNLREETPRLSLIDKSVRRVTEYKPETVMIFLGHKCTNECRHCYTCSSPDCGECLSQEQIDSFLEGVVQKTDPSLLLVSFSGGEPFLYKRLLFGAIKKAISLGITHFDTIPTNACWANTYTNARRVMRQLNNITKTLNSPPSLGVSVDKFHAEFIKPKQWYNAIRAYKNVFPKGEAVIMTFYLNSNDGVDALLSQWRSLGRVKVKVRRYYLLPVGRAALLDNKEYANNSQIMYDMFFRSSWDAGLEPIFAIVATREGFYVPVRSLALLWDGTLYICKNLASIGVMPLGHISEGVEAVLQRLDKDPLTASLTQLNGRADFVRAAREVGVSFNKTTLSRCSLLEFFKRYITTERRIVMTQSLLRSSGKRKGEDSILSDFF